MLWALRHLGLWVCFFPFFSLFSSSLLVVPFMASKHPKIILWDHLMEHPSHNMWVPQMRGAHQNTIKPSFFILPCNPKSNPFLLPIKTLNPTHFLLPNSHQNSHQIIFKFSKQPHDPFFFFFFDENPMTLLFYVK